MNGSPAFAIGHDESAGPADLSPLQRGMARDTKENASTGTTLLRRSIDSRPRLRESPGSLDSQSSTEGTATVSLNYDIDSPAVKAVAETHAHAPEDTPPGCRGETPPILGTALWALDSSLWPVAVHPFDAKVNSPGKAPIGQGWGKDRPDAASIRATFRRHPKANVGLKLGAEGGVIDIDVDQPQHADATLARMFPDGIPPTKGWANADGKFHLLFLWDDRLAGYGKSIIKGVVGPGGEITGNPNYLGLEIRIGAAPGSAKQFQTVIPPSLMVNGVARRWNDHAEILPLPESVFADMDRHAIEKPVNRPAPPEKEKRSRGPVSSADRYALAALDRESAAVASSTAGGRNDALNSAAFALGQLVGAGSLGRVTVEDALRGAAHDAGLSDAEINPTLRSGLEAGMREPRDLSSVGTGGHNGDRPPLRVVSPDQEAETQANSERPHIVITTERHEVVDQAVTALSRDPRVFQRAHSLVAVRRDTAPGKGFIRPSGSPVIVDLPLPTLGERLTENAAWSKLRKTRDGDFEAVAAQIPDWAIAATSARGEWADIRHLEAVVEAPVLRPDGSILDAPGYDDRTGLLYEPGAKFLPVPGRPTRDDAKLAADELLALVADFPFACESGNEPNRGFDAAAWLAGVLTPFARFAIAGPCPMFLFDANVAGSGKSKLCDLIAIIGSGRPMARTDYPDDNDEMRKCITAIALAGDRTMLLDNIAVTFGGSALDGALTGQTWRGRILGLSKMTPELPLFTVWYGTGNNVAFRGDAVRRIVQCRLDSPEERPEERRGFRIEGDLLAHALNNRPQLVRAVLTMLRAYHVAGRPKQDLTPMDFVAWAEVVRSSIFWATGLDPCAGKRRILATDPKTMERISLINGWAELPHAEIGLTAAEAIQILRDERNTRRFDTLRNALLECSRNGDLPTARQIGMKLTAIKGQVIDGKSFESRDAGKGTWAWRVVTATPPNPGGTSGTGGTHDIPTRENWYDNCNTSFTGLEGNCSHQSHQSHHDGDREVIEL